MAQDKNGNEVQVGDRVRGPFRDDSFSSAYTPNMTSTPAIDGIIVRIDPREIPDSFALVAFLRKAHYETHPPGENRVYEKFSLAMGNHSDVHVCVALWYGDLREVEKVE